MVILPRGASSYYDYDYSLLDFLGPSDRIWSIRDYYYYDYDYDYYLSYFLGVGVGGGDVIIIIIIFYWGGEGVDQDGE